MPDITFTSNFSYSSSGVYHYDVDPLSLTVYNDCADLGSNGLDVIANPSNQLVLNTFNSFKYARKQTKALFVRGFDFTVQPVFDGQTVHGFFNPSAFTPESLTEINIAFNTTNNNQVQNFSVRSDFTNVARAQGNFPTNNITDRHVVTANNCIHFPDLSRVIGVPIIFAQANQIGQYDETKLLKAPRVDQSSFTRNTANRYPEVLPAIGINEQHHISMVSSFNAYYYTVGSGGSNALRIVKLPYKSSEVNASSNNSTPITPSVFLLNIATTYASSTMWVDGFNDLFVSHGDKVFRISTQLPAQNIWIDSAFLPTNFTTYNIISNSSLAWSYTIERAIVHYKTGKHYALCSRVPTGQPRVVSNTIQYVCELTINVTNSTVFIQELNGIPIPILATDNKHINIPTYSDYLIYTCDDPLITCCDLRDFILHPLNTFMNSTDDILDESSNNKVVSITQPTVNSSSNYLTVNTDNHFTVWKLKPLAKNY